jgi:hypothetical protein
LARHGFCSGPRPNYLDARLSACDRPHTASEISVVVLFGAGAWLVGGLGNRPENIFGEGVEPSLDTRWQGRRPRDDRDFLEREMRNRTLLRVVSLPLAAAGQF